ncbi:hypothetical protein WJX73_004739 [Symbiochloris irregularis]|uniref:Protein preY, mitochondrial n=1 Tax=Symbiochloris irregularis TaxID=706552 RepID=A0AAW1PD00_9CHLO
MSTSTDESPVPQADSFNEDLLGFLCCPISKSLLRWDAAHSELICDQLKVAFPVVTGVPKLVPSDGRFLPEEST